MAFPTEFIRRTRSLLGDEAYEALEKALREEPPVSIRLNPLKGGELQEKEPVAWCASGVDLPERHTNPDTRPVPSHTSVSPAPKTSTMPLGRNKRRHETRGRM